MMKYIYVTSAQQAGKYIMYTCSQNYAIFRYVMPRVWRSSVALQQQKPKNKHTYTVSGKKVTP